MRDSCFIFWQKYLKMEAQVLLNVHQFGYELRSILS
jgi:hypothetical protein